MAPFSKPETVLKQAEGLVSVGQSHAALQSLTEMFSSKRVRSYSLTSLEPVMLRFVELCVEMRKGRVAKEGLMQYKNMAQNTSIASIEVVIKKFVALADAKVQEAQEKAEKAVAVTDVDDLEAIETPESILLGAVSGDQSKDRTDRSLVTPWLKFLWESYRTALETLNNNARLETIYQQIAQQAFKFCLKHDRKVEFRRLCEIMRQHLSKVEKYSHQTHAINLSDAETLQRHLDTRFAALNTSAELELWQEAFRSIEDIHKLLTMAGAATSKDGSKKGLGVRPAMMANYYEKLTKIFLTSSDGTALGSSHALFHAASWARYYGVVRSMAGKSDDEMSKLAGQVLISALAVPDLGLAGAGKEEGVEVEGLRDRVGRLSALLGLTRTPTREGLLKEALSRNAHKLAPAPIQQLYQTLEVTFDPLSLCTSIAPILSELANNPAYEAYAPYLPLLQRAVLSRLLGQLSQVYTNMQIDNLMSLVSPLETIFEGAWGRHGVEAFLMGCARRGEVAIRVDHISGSITFVDEAFGSSESVAGPSGSSATIQPSHHELVRTRLSGLATCLYNALQQIDPPPPTAVVKNEDLIAAALAEREAIKLRRRIINRRLVDQEERTARQKMEDEMRRMETSKRETQEAERRALDEAKRREQERIKRDIEKIRQEEAAALAKSLKEKGTLKVDLSEIADLDADNLMRLQVEQLDKETKDRNERVRIIAKRLDHVERAYRKEERPLLALDYDQQQIDDRVAFDAAQKAQLQAARETHKENLETKKRLARLVPEYKTKKDTLISRRGEAYAKRREEARQNVELEKAKRRKMVLKEREEERKRIEDEERLRREAEEEEERREEERIAEERRLLEEEEAKAAAEEAKKHEEEEKKREEEEKKNALRIKREQERAADAERLRKQREREEEAEARAAERAKQRFAPPARTSTPEVVSGWRRQTGGTPTPASPIRQATTTPPRTESPSGPTRYKPPAVRSDGPQGGGWRAREAARATGGSTTPQRPASPAVPSKAEDDGFQPVSKGAWRPSRGRGRGERM